MTMHGSVKGNFQPPPLYMCFWDSYEEVSRDLFQLKLSEEHFLFEILLDSQYLVTYWEILEFGATLFTRILCDF